MTTAEPVLPPWAVASLKRRAHITRVMALALAWADAMGVEGSERDAWRDATRWHDALRDAGEAELRAIVPQLDWPAATLHGPAAAAKLVQDGEHRSSVLDAIHWHTIGNASWDRTGRVLYMADYLEPGRSFDRETRAKLAQRAPLDFDGTFRDVVMIRLGQKVKSGEPLRAESMALWESVR